MKSKQFAKLSVLLIISLVTTIFAAPIQVNAANSAKEGDYVKFGKYNNQPILWRVIDFDENGNPLLFSDKILCTKAFDATGTHKTANGGQEETYYSNWEMSNLRAWLNSSAAAGSVVFPCGNPPVGEDLRVALPYDQEKGFLADGNFTASERALIKTVKQRVLLSDVDNRDADGGSIDIFNGFGMFGGKTDENGNEYLDINDAMKNYDKSYYKFVEDKMFLLDEKQIYDYYNKFGEYGSRFTKEAAAEMNKFEEMRGGWTNFKENDLYGTTLRSPHFSDMVIEISSNGRIIAFPAFWVDKVVRPAFYLDLSGTSIGSGTGTEKDPYVLSTGVEAPKASISVDIDGKAVDFNNNFGYPFVDSANRTQVPLRITMESYGASVGFDPQSSTAIVSKDGVEVRIPIGQKYILKNGEKIAIDTAAIIKDKRTYLPIRAVVEALAGQVTWDSTNKVVGIKDIFKMINTSADQIDAAPIDKAIAPGTTVKVAADPRKGFNYDYLLYMPTTVSKQKESTIMVETLNVDSTKDAQDAAAQSYNVLLRGEAKIADDLGSPFIIPCIERPTDINPLLYTHGFDRDTLLQKTGRYARLDLQVASMIKDSQNVLKKAGYPVDDKVFMWGFSGSGQFAHRFTALYPDLVKAAATGGNSKVILPITSLNGTKLIFPIGIADLKTDANIAFDQKAYLDVPQFMFFGGKDNGQDDVYFLDSYSRMEQEIIFKIYGEGDTQFYWNKTQELNKPYSANIEYKIYPELAHTYDDTVLSDVTAFFKKYQ